MRYLVGLGCLLLSVQVAAAPIESLARLLEPYRTFSADFKQSTLDPGGSPINQITGELAIESETCLLYTSPSPRDVEESRMPSSA